MHFWGVFAGPRAPSISPATTTTSDVAFSWGGDHGFNHQSHNTISHTVQSMSFSSENTNNRYHALYVLLVDVCAVQSATPLWLNSHVIQSVTQHNQSHNTIRHTVQSVTNYLRVRCTCSRPYHSDSRIGSNDCLYNST